MADLNLDNMRAELAKQNGLGISKQVACYYCKHWGYNCGKVITSQFESKCQVRKENTCSSNWCRRFEVEA
jgi:hypothetical protein